MRRAAIVATALVLWASSLGALGACSSAIAPTSGGDAGRGPGAGSDDSGPPGTTSGGPGSSDAATDPDAPPTGPPAIRYVGRTDTRDPAGTRLGWSGSNVIVRFSGTSLTAKLAETNLYRGPSRYDVIVDGQLQPAPLAPAEGTSDNPIATGLAAGTHVVELWRRTEGQVAITQFLSFDFGGGTLLAPPNPVNRRIEFLGDSESAGYGIECANADEAFSGATENEHKAFPALIAESLSADHSDIAYSGKGVSRNYDVDDTISFASIYPRALPDDPSSTWSFASWVPDVVVIALGTNDYANPDVRSAPDVVQFKAKYHELVALVRAQNPNAQIVCAAEGNLNDGYPVGWNAYTNVTTTLKAVVAERNAAPLNDPKVHYYEFPQTDQSGANGAPDVTGCDEHPNAGYHQRAAADAAPKLKALMGW